MNRVISCTATCLLLAVAFELSAQSTNWTTVEAALGRKETPQVLKGERFQISACCFRPDTELFLSSAALWKSLWMSMKKARRSGLSCDGPGRS
jgi:hypothetical protein